MVEELQYKNVTCIIFMYMMWTLYRVLLFCVHDEDTYLTYMHIIGTAVGILYILLKITERSFVFSTFVFIVLYQQLAIPSKSFFLVDIFVCVNSKWEFDDNQVWSWIHNGVGWDGKGRYIKTA